MDLGRTPKLKQKEWVVGAFFGGLIVAAVLSGAFIGINTEMRFLNQNLRLIVAALEQQNKNCR